MRGMPYFFEARILWHSKSAIVLIHASSHRPIIPHLVVSVLIGQAGEYLLLGVTSLRVKTNLPKLTTFLSNIDDAVVSVDESLGSS
jgi:hypothetical protein